MSAVFLLTAQFGDRAVIPIDDVRREYFSQLELDKFLRKIAIDQSPFILCRSNDTD